VRSIVDFLAEGDGRGVIVNMHVDAMYVKKPR
jgi:hypothetical protein